MSMEEIFATFIAESRDLLDDMERGLFVLERSPDDAELLNTIFRAAHTIKGSSGLFSLDAIVSFTHTVENLLDALRNGRLNVDPSLVNDLLRVVDVLRQMIDKAERREPVDAGGGDIQALIRAMQARLGAGGPRAADAPPDKSHGGSDPGSRRWHLQLQFDADTARAGIDPLSLIRYLDRLGQVRHVEPWGMDRLTNRGFDPEQIYVAFDIAYDSPASREEILSVFEWTTGNTRIEVLGPDPEPAAFRALLPDDTAQKQAAIMRWLNCGSIDAVQADRVLGASSAQGAASDSARTMPATSRADPEARFVRVDARRLDKLINLVGELVIAGSGARMLASQTGNEELTELSASILQLVEDVRDTSLSLRTVPLDTIFSRFTRVVRELSQDLGKQIEITFEGGDTEIDRSLIERVTDPLMHLVRNAADHGIETPDIRAQSGKPAAGRIHLHAYHDSGSVVVEIQDDGRGIDAERVRRKAIDNGLIRSDQPLTQEQIYDLLFQPGFSTASTVTNVSGRGVGLDVVRKNLAQIRGSVEISSRHGLGSSFKLRLPLTLAIIDGFLVSLGKEKYVIPVEMIRECIEAPMLTDADRACDFFNLRGTVLPYARLRKLFGRNGNNGAVRENLVVTQIGDRVAGLVVDELLGESQTVIKPLGPLFGGAAGIGGATILGTGEVALILDVPALINTLDFAALPEGGAAQRSASSASQLA
jgi:two-component system, chemotaxis family, sensor kinase CheA